MAETSSGSREYKKIDIVSFLKEILYRLRSLWWVIIVTTLAAALLSYFASTTTYTPRYVAEATVSVRTASSTTTDSSTTAEQLGSIFPSILTSGALSNVVAADLGRGSVPGTIRFTNISGTNLLTISVTSGNPENAYKVLQSVIRNYPSVAQFVVGRTELTVIEDGGIPVDTGYATTIRGSVLRGALIGFVTGLVFLLIYALTFRTIRTEADLKRVLNVESLGSLPYIRKKKRRKSDREELNILYNRDQTGYIEAMRVIRTRVSRRMEGKKVLMVTSSVPSEGKSTVAANLAVSMARKGRRVILVDCDLRAPSQSRIFGMPEDLPGLFEVLSGKASVEEALYRVSDGKGKPTNILVISGSTGTAAKNISMLASDAMRALVADLRNRTDLVIFDTPPSAMLADAMMLVRETDGVAYVIMSDYTRQRYIIKGVEELAAADAPLIGCILNGGKSQTEGYGYGKYGYGYGKYGYGYGYGYSSGYGYTSSYTPREEN